MSQPKSVNFPTSNLTSSTQHSGSAVSSNADDYEFEVEYVGERLNEIKTKMIGTSKNESAEQLWTPMLTQLCSIVPHARSANMLESLTLYEMSNSFYETYGREMTDDEKTNFVRISVMKRYVEMRERGGEFGDETAMENLKTIKIVKATTCLDWER